ncbi:hypothetical protein JM93_03173 [Roseibium hamelinense]|uniref:Uncharacterized protein n=1 Tax=Roseibium hamelinense TaxID=150831 RepID=A0A562SVJ8_9HYPH|nr:hypothetical protein [Roseibium hamelinense]TWI84836.1 hypothetical protein JM93_03173 [Roseibium hamelinense]
MIKFKYLAGGAIAFALGLTAQPQFTGNLAGAGAILAFPVAKAQTAERNTARRTARRTSRRTTRRVNYRQSVSGCAPYQAYYNCGGVYYAPQVQDGVTVYVVVNP